MCPPAFMVPKDPSLNRVKATQIQTLWLAQWITLRETGYPIKSKNQNVKLFKAIPNKRFLGRPDEYNFSQSV